MDSSSLASRFVSQQTIFRILRELWNKLSTEELQEIGWSKCGLTIVVKDIVLFSKTSCLLIFSTDSFQYFSYFMRSCGFKCRCKNNLRYEFSHKNFVRYNIEMLSYMHFPLRVLTLSEYTSKSVKEKRAVLTSLLVELVTKTQSLLPDENPAIIPSQDKALYSCSTSVQHPVKNPVPNATPVQRQSDLGHLDSSSIQEPTKCTVSIPKLVKSVAGLHVSTPRAKQSPADCHIPCFTPAQRPIGWERSDFSLIHNPNNVPESNSTSKKGQSTFQNPYIRKCLDLSKHESHSPVQLGHATPNQEFKCLDKQIKYVPEAANTALLLEILLKDKEILHRAEEKYKN